MRVLIKYNGQPIGEQTPVGKMLDKAAFLTLKNVHRLRAYLLLAYPYARRARTLGHVCRVPYDDIANYLKPDLRDGVVVRLERGWYRAQPIAEL